MKKKSAPAMLGEILVSSDKGIDDHGVIHREGLWRQVAKGVSCAGKHLSRDGTD